MHVIYEYGKYIIISKLFKGSSHAYIRRIMNSIHPRDVEPTTHENYAIARLFGVLAESISEAILRIKINTGIMRHLV